MFDQVHDYDDDPIESVYARAASDTRPHALNLSIGVYRDATGEVTVMDAVRRAEDRLLARRRPKGYLSPLGNTDYRDAMQRLVLGESHPVLRSQRLVSAQGPGAGGMLRVAAELIRVLAPEAKVWLSDPIWEHQVDFFTSAGVPVVYYPYYDCAGNTLRFDAMLDAWQQLAPGDVVLLHGCCHNPTGADLTIDQWRAVAAVLTQKQALPFVDVAYQGFGDGIEPDVAGVQLLAEQMDEMLLAVSSSKSFTLYRDRVGLLVLVTRSGADRVSLERYLRDRIRANYFMPPDHGAAIVAEILTDPGLAAIWRAELDRFRTRIVASRLRLQRALQERVPESDWRFLLAHKGMFSCMPLTPPQLATMEREHAIYLLPNGRLNFAALAEEHTGRVADAICAGLKN